MARRNLLIAVLFLLGALVAFRLFFTSPSKDLSRQVDSDMSISSQQRSLESEAIPAAVNNAQVREEVSVTNNTQSLTRQVRDPVHLQGAPKLDARGANLRDEAFLQGTRWKLWPDVTAVPKKHGAPQGQVLGEVNGFYIVKKSSETDVKNFSSDHPIVVVDSRLNEVGVVTGVFSVVLKEGTSADQLQRISGLKVLNSFPHIRTYFVTASEEPFNLQDLQDFLKQESFAENIEMEVLSRQYEKH